MEEGQPLAPVGAPHRTSHTRLVVALTVSIVIALLISAYLFVVMQVPLPGVLGRTLSALTLPEELRSSHFISASPRGTLVYTHAGSSYREQAHLTGAVRSLVPVTHGYAALETKEDGSGQRLYVGETLIAEGASLRSLAASPDGRRIAYVTTEDGSPYSSDPSRWVVNVYYPDPGTTQVIGRGFAPFFIDDVTIGYFTAVGIFAVNIETGVPSALMRETFTYPFEVALISPDRTHIAWQDTDRVLHAYVITGMSVAPAGTFSFADVRGASSITLGDTGFYTVRATNYGSEVWKQGYDGTLVRVVTLPPSLETTRLLFTSSE